MRICAFKNTDIADIVCKIIARDPDRGSLKLSLFAFAILYLDFL